MNTKLEETKGITLIALIITIIILIILSAIAIKSILDIGIVKFALKGTEDYSKKQEEELREAEELGNYLKEELSQKTEGDETLGLSGNKSIIGEIAKITKSGNYQIKIAGNTEEKAEKEEIYNLHVIKYDGNLILDGINNIEGATLIDRTYEFGDNSMDVATNTENAKNMVVLKVKGNLEIKEGVNLTACKSPEGYRRTFRNDNILHRYYRKQRNN